MSTDGAVLAGLIVVVGSRLMVAPGSGGRLTMGTAGATVVSTSASITSAAVTATAMSPRRDMSVTLNR